MDYNYGSKLRRILVSNLERFEPQTDAEAEGKRAAVAVVVINACDCSPGCGITPSSPDEAAVVLTVRSERLHTHAGQWALPGGVMEDGEKPEEAALRELDEELGVSLGDDAVLGRLDDFSTRSGYTITPVVMWGQRNPLFVPNPDEVASIHCIPLREFQRDDAPILQVIPESDQPVLYMPVGNNWIASPTGAIIYQFARVAFDGHHVRVSHFEQPLFAWR